MKHHNAACRRAESIMTALLNDDEHLAANLLRQDPDPHRLAWAALRMLAATFKAVMSNRGDDPREEWRKHLLHTARRYL